MMQSLVPSVTVLSLVSLVKSAGPSWWGQPRRVFRGFGGLSQPRRGPHRGSVPPLISMPHRCGPSSGGPVTPGASRDMALVPKCSLSRRLARTRADEPWGLTWSNRAWTPPWRATALPVRPRSGDEPCSVVGVFTDLVQANRVFDRLSSGSEATLAQRGGVRRLGFGRRVRILPVAEGLSGGSYNSGYTTSRQRPSGRPRPQGGPGVPLLPFYVNVESLLDGLQLSKEGCRTAG